ncbi:MAG: adenylate/guanylate cyclase domain-containing protein [Kofleriaceae bacterium]
MSEEIAADAVDQVGIKLGGERRDAAVLFSDLRGFTAYAERLPPEQLIAELNGYLAAMVPVIETEHGLIDKYIGDAIMAVFGIPTPRGDEAACAIRAAHRMQTALVEHNRARAAAGLPPLVQGIGVHFGPVVAGNIGTAQRVQYTVVGDVVNLASRLESATKDHEVAVLLSEDVVAAAAADAALLPPTRAVAEIAVRGRSAGLRVYTLDDTAALPASPRSVKRTSAPSLAPPRAATARSLLRDGDDDGA